MLLTRFLALVLSLSPLALAAPQSLNVDVGSNSPASLPSPGYGAAAGSVGVWNVFNPVAAAPVALVGLNGGPTSALLSIVGGLGAAQFNDPATSGDDQALMDDFGSLALSGGAASYVFTGLEDGRYDVYVYAWTANSTSSTTQVLVSGGEPCVETSGAGAWTGHAEGLTYSRQNVAVSGGALTVDVASGFGQGACNGIQLVKKITSGLSTSTLGVVRKRCQFSPPVAGYVAVDVESAFDLFWVLWIDPSTQDTILVGYDRTTCAPIFNFANIVSQGALSMSSRSVNGLNEFVMAGASDLTVYQFNASTGVLTCVHQTTIPHKKEVAFVLDVPDCFYSVTPSGQIEKCTLDPVTYALNCSFVANTSLPVPTGLAFDYVSGVLWTFSRAAACPVTEDLVRFRALDPATGADLGVGFTGDLTRPTPNLALGCGLHVENGSLCIVALHQGGAQAEMVVYALGIAVPPSVVTYCTSGVSTNGCSASITASAQPSATLSNPCVLSVSNVEGAKQGLVFYGVTGPLASPWGTSFLCVKAPTQRTGTQSSGGVANTCTGAFSLDWNAFLTANPSALGTPFIVGEKVYAQGWYRDPPSPKSTNLSNGLELTVVP